MPSSRQSPDHGMDFRKMVRPRGLEPPRVAPLAPQASASTNSATTACGGGRVPETTRDRADVTARLRPDKPAGAYSNPAGCCPPPWHPRYGASKDRQQSPRHAGPAARPKTHSGGLDHFRRTGQQLFDFHRDAIAADDDHAARHRHVVRKNADLVLLGRVEFNN